MRSGLLLIPLLAAAVWIALRRPPPPALAQTPGDLLQLRITVGLTDTAPKEWSGRLTASSGQIESLLGWRFSGPDSASPDGSFSFATRTGNLENQLRANYPYGQTGWGDPNIQRLIPEGLTLRLRGGNAARLRFESSSGSFDFDASAVSFHSPLSTLNGNARVELLPVEATLSDSGSADDHPAMALTSDGRPWYAWLAFDKDGDYVVVSDGARSTRITEKGDFDGPALAVTPNGWVHAVWAAREGADFHLYSSTLALGRWTVPRRLTTIGGSNISPQLASDGLGRLALAWQALRGGRATILVRLFDGRNWGPEIPMSDDRGNAWAPSAAFGGGRLWIAWDSYATGSYQIYARTPDQAPHRVTAGGAFSVRPSVAVTPAGVPIVAWEESDPHWGKDYALLTTGTDRTPLYKNRRVRAATLEGSDWKELPGIIAESMPASQRRFLQQPRLALDPAGRLHLAFRARTSAATARIDYWASGGRWETFLTRLDGSRWLPAQLMPSSLGRNGMRAVIAASAARLHLAWPSDHRTWPQNRYGDLEIHAASLPLAGGPSNLRDTRPMAAPTAEVSIAAHPNEAEDVRRIRAHRITVNGKTYRILRGDLHRHTELSPDGAGDGSLEDLYRYNLDAAAMDYTHVADHQMGNDELYNWWITQKSNDLYYLPERFVPLYGYERSVRYPNGHRNVIWAERGKPVLTIGPSEQAGEINTGSVLYPYLRLTSGIVTSHTSATPQGTDWRDHDPALEPIVEIYQGFESSYEHAAAPRAWKEGDHPVHTGLRTAGYIWNAWAKGYKLGVQASSDHVSTHTSFACVLVEQFTRQGLLDAMRRRHTYAATDAIILDFQAVTSSGISLMGDITTSTTAPRLLVKAIGTASIRRVDLVKNNTYVHKAEPAQPVVSFEFVDSAFSAGESYYYVRIEQTDGQLAWSSPIWVTRQ